jgi:hypothetical protein
MRIDVLMVALTIFACTREPYTLIIASMFGAVREDWSANSAQLGVPITDVLFGRSERLEELRALILVDGVAKLFLNGWHGVLHHTIIRIARGGSPPEEIG